MEGQKNISIFVPYLKRQYPGFWKMLNRIYFAKGGQIKKQTFYVLSKQRPSFNT
jgi:hypothetical protein